MGGVLVQALNPTPIHKVQQIHLFHQQIDKRLIMVDNIRRKEGKKENLATVDGCGGGFGRHGGCKSRTTSSLVSDLLLQLLRGVSVRRVVVLNVNVCFYSGRSLLQETWENRREKRTRIKE